MNKDKQRLIHASEVALELSKRLMSFANTGDVERIPDLKQTAIDGYDDLKAAMKNARLKG